VKKRNAKNLAIIILLIFGAVDFYFRDSEYSITGNIVKNFDSENGIRIANWNLQIFGISKASDEELMEFYKERINDYDIIFIQEIRDESGTAFEKLCSLLKEYGCLISSRAGRTSSKEQYGVIFNDSIKINYFKDYNPDKQNRWERPPIEVNFNLNGFNLTVFNIHVKPDDVQKELDYLDDIALDIGNVIILGDLNGDCNYYDNEAEKEFNEWNWIIKDNEDTTSGETNCAYDRIISNNELKPRIIRYGIEKEIKKEQSDHYLVWVELR